MKHRTSRRLGALSVASILVALAAAAPISAKAAPLSVVATNLSPSAVTQGLLGAFDFVVTNTGTSNISQLYLTEESGAGVYQVVGDRASSCTTSGQLLCNFGALNAGATFHFQVALIAPAGSTWNVDFEFASTGFVLGTNKSHGDLWGAQYQIATPSTGDTVDTAGTYVWDATHQSFHNGLSLGNNNKQSTSVTLTTAGDTGFPASAVDGSTLTFSCDTLKCPGTFFGQVSQIEVDSGLPHTIHVVIQLYKPGRNPSNINGVYHQYIDPTTGNLAAETITQICSSADAPSKVPCFLATKLGSNNLQLDVWITHNGKLGGF